MRPVTVLFITLILLVPSCTRRQRGPTAEDTYDRYQDRFREAEVLDGKGDRTAAIQAYVEAKEALEDLRVHFPKSAFYDERDLAHVKDIIYRLRDEERRGVEAIIAGQEGPPPAEEPPMSGELYRSIKGGIEIEIGKLTNHETGHEPQGLDRVKRVEPDVVDNTPALVIHITANDRFIEGMMHEEVRRDLKEVMKVLRAHEGDLKPYELILLAGYKAVAGAGGYAEPVLMVEYRFTQEAFKTVDWEKLEDQEVDISEFATSSREP